MKLEYFKLEQGKERIIIKKFVKLLKDAILKIRLYIKLKRMDDWWYFTGASSWRLFPPSFYHTHSEEEIKRITDETLEKLRTMLAELEGGNCS